MAFCKNCNTQVDDGSLYCTACGKPIQQKNTCTQCGAPLDDNDKYCPNCGLQTTTQQDETPLSAKEKAKPHKGNIILGCIAVLAILVGYWYWQHSHQDLVVNNDNSETVEENDSTYSIEGLADAAANYDVLGDFHEGLAVVEKNGKYGYIDKKGTEIIPCIYDISNFYEDGSYYVDNNFYDGLACVRKNGKYGYIDRTGKEVIPLIYEEAEHFSDGLAYVVKDNKREFIDKTGKTVFTFIYDIEGDEFASPSFLFQEGLLYVGKDGKWGYIDKTGKEVIPCIYDNRSKFSEGLACVQKNGKWGFIDKTGKEIIPCIYDEYSFAGFSEGLVAVAKDNKWGYIDKTGNVVIPLKYDSANRFSEGLAAVEKDGVYNIIDKNENMPFSSGYDDIDYFKNGLSVVRKRREGYFYINSKDYLMWDCGFIDKTGNVVIPLKYDSVNRFSEGLAVVQKDGIYGYIDKNGKSTFDIQNEQQTSETINHEWVDLGLSSGLKWATCNVGASYPSDYGDYFAWGEITTKSEYTETNSKTYEKNIGDISGNPQYDAARANWGGIWRLPTEAEMKELSDKCKWTWTTQGGHNGYNVTGPNGKSIFLPAAGWRRGSSLNDAGDDGYYWSSTPYDAEGSYGLGFGNNGYGVEWNYRYRGLTVRPVSE